MAPTRRKVCIVTPSHWSAEMGGAQYQIQCLLDALTSSNRYEFYFLARRVAADFQSSSYRVVRTGGARKLWRLGYCVDAVPLYRALLKIRPDVIYQRVGCGYTGIAAHYARRHRARLVWHVAHDTDVMRQIELDAQSNFVRRFLEKRSLEYGIRRATRIVAQTEHQSQLLERNYGRKADAVIPNFQPEPTEVLDKTGPILIVWVANFKPWKQPEVFVRLANSLADVDGLRFVMVGAPLRGPREQAQSGSLMRDIERAKNLMYLGELAQRDINALLARSHVFVNTSLHEGFANTFIQAWARGVPVVSLHANPDDVFSREMIGVHAGTEDRLEQVVRMLVTDSQLLAQYSRRAREYAVLHHSMANAELLARFFDP